MFAAVPHSGLSIGEALPKDHRPAKGRDQPQRSEASEKTVRLVSTEIVGSGSQVQGVSKEGARENLAR